MKQNRNIHGTEHIRIRENEAFSIFVISKNKSSIENYFKHMQGFYHNIMLIYKVKIADCHKMW
jgi:hypothetical protein